jgi:hypothetical protein
MVSGGFDFDLMRRLASIVALLTVLAVGRGTAAPTSDRIWFSPGPGTIDYTSLFTHPEEWTHAQELFDVFKFYQQHTQTPAAAIVGPNSYDALVRAGAFQTLTRWGKKIALEAGSVKDFYCTPDASGMNASIQGTIDSIRAVQQAGGTVSYIAQDEPFVSGRDRVCGGPALEPTADRVAQYVTGVTAAFPNTKIGLIEAYPFSSESAIETIVQLLRARGATPAFLHMDADWHLAGAAGFTRDMLALQSFCQAQGIPFGIIVNGNNSETDPQYANDVFVLNRLIVNTFGTWARMPDQIIVQSWAVTSTGQSLTPSNLPEDRLYTHTEILWDVVRRLKGANGSSTGSAIIR